MKDIKKIFEHIKKKDFVVNNIDVIAQELKLNWRTVKSNIQILKSLDFPIITYREYVEHNLLELQNLCVKYKMYDKDTLLLRKITKIIRGRFPLNFSKKEKRHNKR